MESKIDPKDFEGVNPMEAGTWHDDMTEHEFDLNWFYLMSGVAHTFGNGKQIMGFNFDPYILNKDGKKIFYQRPLCWTLQNKQNLIESIYLGLNCGDVVLKYNDDDRAVEVGAEMDVVDGKQRIHAIIEFFNNEFPDMHGNYFKDFSKVAQRMFKNRKAMHIFMLREKCSDEKVKRAFLNVNFTGVPMSKEHIEFVKSINV